MLYGIIGVILLVVVMVVTPALSNYFHNRHRKVKADSKNEDVGTLEEYKFTYRNIKDD